MPVSRQAIFSTPIADFDHHAGQHYGVFYPSQLAARHMMKADGGAILITASTAGVVGYRHYADYNASKGAVLAMMRTMAIELAPKIRVNAINPGYTSTPMQDAEYSPEMLRRVNGIIPCGGMAARKRLEASMFTLPPMKRHATGGFYLRRGGKRWSAAITGRFVLRPRHFPLPQTHTGSRISGVVEQWMPPPLSCILP
jgi:NAD(P)-dependent dehydrogenase (short-subunit alcohol dehydrogenase family)